MKPIKSDNTKFILIHGFGGGVHEVKPLAEHLIGMGFDAVCPLLKGHSSTRKEMRMATCEDWIGSAEKELLNMMDNGRNIILIGFSMGGLIAFNLACKYNVKAIVTINTPIYYWNLKQVFFNILDDLKNKKYHNCRRYLIETGNFPFKSLLQFLTLLHNTKLILDKVNCPALMIQAEDDDTVRKKSLAYIHRHLSSENKVMKYFKKGGHAILLSPASDQVISCVDDFLREI